MNKKNSSSLQNSLTEILPGGIELEMILIPSGTFLMGSNDEDDEASKYEKPQHCVTIAPFYIGKYPITQEQYLAIMGNNPSLFPQCLQNPVENVTWYDSQDCCLRLSKITGNSYRLPTEAEWEYAARAGTQSRFYFGNDEHLLEEYAWYESLRRDENDCDEPHPVGLKKPNQWGLYDMLGNVWEWCGDHWHDNYDNAPTYGTVWLNEQYTEEYTLSVKRGGSWYDWWEDCRCAKRTNAINKCSDGTKGFRVVLDY